MNLHTLLALGAAFLIVASAPASSTWAAEPPAGQAASSVADERVNINTATEAELVKLHGINRSVARRIVEYREAHGEFKKPEDIRRVSGVGKTLWEQNRSRIVVK
jgi:competence protein ComEA